MSQPRPTAARTHSNSNINSNINSHSNSNNNNRSNININNNNRHGKNNVSSTTSSSSTSTSTSSTSFNPKNLTNRSLIVDDNIQPPPLFKKHLQPSTPPPSATPHQLELFQRVLHRRSKQLHSFSLPIHQSLFESLTLTNTSTPSSSSPSASPSSSASTSSASETLPVTASEITNLFQKLPSKKPTTKYHYISLIHYLLTDNFHSSCDNRLNTKGRTHCLQKVKYILYNIDVAFEKRTKELESIDADANANANVDANVDVPVVVVGQQKTTFQSLREKEEGRILQKAREEKARIMGSFVSKPPPSVATSTGTVAGSSNDNEIIILDDTPPSSPINNTRASLSLPTTAVTALPVASSELAIAKIPTTTTTTTTATTTTATTTKEITKQPFTFKRSTKIPPSQSYIPHTITQTRPFYTSQGSYNTSSTLPPPSQVLNLIFLADSKSPSNSHYTISNSLIPRNRAEISINTALHSCRDTILEMETISIPPPLHFKPRSYSSIYLDGRRLCDFENRLMKWDPYWKMVCDCSTFRTKNYTKDIGYKTTVVTKINLDTHGINSSSIDKKELPRTGCVFPIQFQKLFTTTTNSNSVQPNEKISDTIEWGSIKQNKLQPSYINNERRVIVRTLPILPNPKYKKIRSDTPLWPKGTFLQLDARVIQLNQRKQQQHDYNLWKGLSYTLDITEHISRDNLKYLERIGKTMDLSLCTKDGEMYGVQVAVCDYVSPDSLFDICMSSGRKGSIAKMNYDDGLRHAMKYFEKETLVLDSDDDDDDDDDENNNGGNNDAIPSLTCSLVCPVSMQVIRTPVRGKACKHLNCFDLRTYLRENSRVSGGRWRCYVCEDFIAVDDLIYDGFIAQVLETHGKDVNTANRDKVQLSNDGSWDLVDEASSSMKRNQKKRKQQESHGSDKLLKQSEGSIAGEALVIDID